LELVFSIPSSVATDGGASVSVNTMFTLAVGIAKY